MIAHETYILLGIVILALGTYSIRYSGFYLANQIVFKQHHQQILSDSACVLLFTLAVLNTIFTDNQFSGISKIIGISVSLLFAWKNYSLTVVILIAISMTAALRALGLS